MGNDYAKKTCPRCGEELFADMQVCYGCLYDFTRSDNGPSEIAEAIDEPEGIGDVDPAAPLVRHVTSRPPGRREQSKDSLTGASQSKSPADAPGPTRSYTAVATCPDDELTCVLTDASSKGRPHGVWVRTESADVFVPMGEGGLAVGRGSGNQVILHDRSVSRRHLRLSLAPGGVEAIDLGSTNPARLKGRPVESSVLVPWGEELQLGEAVLAMCE